MSNRSNRSKRRPAGGSRSSNRGGSRGPGREPVTSGTESGAGPTEQVLGQASVLATWAANSPEPEVDQGPWETVNRVQLDGAPDEEPETGEGLGFDPDLAFGLAQERVDPLPAGATVSDGGVSGSAGRTRAAGSTGSSPDAGGVPNPLQARGRAKVFATLAAAAVMAVSGLLNERLALDDEDETWLADKQDVAAIGDPAGRLIARRLPLPEGTDTTDLADVVEIVIGGAGYLLKNAMARAAAVRERRRMLREAGASTYPGA